MLASQISPQWAPPSERPKTAFSCCIIVRMSSRLPLA
jgi:hypothetical protein